jgi:ABC-type cobalt transport system substrate-binding protein
MYRVLEQRFFLILLLGLAVLFTWFAFSWDGFYGGADNIAHYRISRYAFNYPHLFLDHWEKPLFTLLSAPFSRFGFTGLKLFNVSAGILAALFSYRIAKKLKLKNALMVLFFTLFAPIYFILLPGGLTEPLFSLVLVLAIYLFLDQRFVWSAIVVSFLPFTRTEGFIILPLFFLALLHSRRYFTVLLLSTGFVVYSLIGSLHYGDLFWLINQNPYQGAGDIYGSGELLHFVKSAGKITGIPLAILLITGTIFLIIEYIGQKIPSERRRVSNFLLLIAGSFFFYLAAHSYVWGKGIGGSMGLIRVMAGVIPMASLLALKGYNSITDLLRFPVFVRSIFSLALLALIVYYPLKKYRYIDLGEHEKLVAQAAEWFKGSEYANAKLYYFHLYFIHYLDRDPYDIELSFEKIPSGEVPSQQISEGSIIQWDSHFGPNEGRMPLEKLMNDPGLKLLKEFITPNSQKTYKGDDFKVYLFARIDEAEQPAVEE